MASGQRLKSSDGVGSFVVDYGPGSPFVSRFVVLSAYLPVLPGDYNFNGIVDAADYTVWRDTLGTTGVALPADGNNDGQVNLDDYAFWKAHFGETAGSGSGATCDFGRSRTGGIGVANVCGNRLESPARPGRIESPNNSSKRGTHQSTHRFRRTIIGTRVCVPENVSSELLTSVWRRTAKAASSTQGFCDIHPRTAWNYDFRELG